VANLTKEAIKKSLIKLLNERSINKITVKDIVEDCGINRNSFYYHYNDIPSLIEEMVCSEADKIIAVHSRIESIEECLEVAVSFALENKKAVLHIHNSPNREIYESYLWRVCEHVVRAYFNTVFADRPIDEADKEILIRYHKCEGFGQIIDWLSSGMKYDIKADFHRICELRKGSVDLLYNLIPQNSKRFSDSEESTNPAVTVAERES